MISNNMRTRLFCLGLGLVTAIEFLENAMFSFAAAYISGGVDASPEEFSYVTMSYAIATAITILKQRWFAERLGYRLYLIIALSLFGIGGLVSGMSNTAGELICARFLQGLGGGALFTSCRVLIAIGLPPQQRVFAVKCFMYSIYSVSFIAPILAAHFVATASWRWVFLSTFPMAMIAIYLVYLTFPELKRPQAEIPYSVLPLAIFTVCMLLLQFVFVQMQYHFTAYGLEFLLLLGIAAVLIYGFIRTQSRHISPLIDVKALAHERYLTGLVCFFFYYWLSNSSNYLFPHFAQQALGVDVLTTGQIQSVAALCSIFICYLYFTWLRKIPHKRILMVVGLLCQAAAFLFVITLSPQAPIQSLYLPMILKGVFIVCVALPVGGLTFQELATEHFAHGYQTKNILRQLSQTFAISFSVMMIQRRTEFHVSLHKQAISDTQLAYNESFTRLAEMFQAQGYSAQDSQLAALSRIWQLFLTQMQMLAYQDVYRMMFIVCLLFLGFVLLQRKLR